MFCYEGVSYYKTNYDLIKNKELQCVGIMKDNHIQWLTDKDKEQHEKNKILLETDSIKNNLRTNTLQLSMMEDLIQILNQKDWSKLLVFQQCYGNSLNENCMKALKGKINEIFISESEDDIFHVDENGYDLKYKDIKIECKYSKDLILTGIGRDKKKNTSFRFKNSNGGGKIILNDENTADIYLLIQQDAIAYVMKEDVLSNITGTSDLTAKIPSEKINLIYKSDHSVLLQDGPILLNLPMIIERIMKCVSRSIWDGSDIRESLKNCLISIANEL